MPSWPSFPCHALAPELTEDLTIKRRQIRRQRPAGLGPSRPASARASDRLSPSVGPSQPVSARLCHRMWVFVLLHSLHLKLLLCSNLVNSIESLPTNLICSTLPAHPVGIAGAVVCSRPCHGFDCCQEELSMVRRSCLDVFHL